MQTFMPYASFAMSAAVLDRQRLGKQRVEVLQLLKALTAGGGWSHHPAALMWRTYTNALVEYGVEVCNVWRERGYVDTCRDKIEAYRISGRRVVLPPWYGDEAVHASHRSNLLRKDFNHYSQFGWSEPPDLPYVWPGT